MKIAIERNDSDEEVQCLICDMLYGAEALQVFVKEDWADGPAREIICDNCLRKGLDACVEILRKQADECKEADPDYIKSGLADLIAASGPWPTLKDLEAAWETTVENTNG